MPFSAAVLLGTVIANVIRGVESYDSVSQGIIGIALEGIRTVCTVLSLAVTLHGRQASVGTIICLLTIAICIVTC